MSVSVVNSDSNQAFEPRYGYVVHLEKVFYKHFFCVWSHCFWQNSTIRCISSTVYSAADPNATSFWYD